MYNTIFITWRRVWEWYNDVQLIENICFFEVYTKYISLSVLKTSEFSRVRSEMTYIWYSLQNKKAFFFYLYLLEDLWLIN